MSSEAKLDLILHQLANLQATVEDFRSSIRDVKEEVNAVRYEVDCHMDRLNKLESDMQEQKDASNQQQQQLRSLTLRLLNFPVTIGEKEDNNAGLRARVYDTILKPLLAAAKAAKDINSVPQAATLIEACFRPFNTTAASNSDDDPPPHVIIKLSSRLFKIAILKRPDASLA